MPSTAQLCVKVTRKAYRTKKCWKFTSEDRKHKDLLKVRDEICGKPRRGTKSSGHYSGTLFTRTSIPSILLSQ